MEGLFVILVLAVGALPVAAIWLVVAVSRLRARVAELELRIGAAADEAREALLAARGPASERTAPVAEAPASRADGAPPLEAPTPDEGRPLPPPLPQAAPPRPTPVREPGWLDGLASWARANLVHIAAAVSLGLAGIFLVQYGVEAGLLTPALRVGLAGLLGLALVAGGEVVRRRWGDEAGSPTAVLPSTLSGAGIVALYAAVLGARFLYGLIGPEAALAGLVAVASAALVLGWLHGPFLAAAGLAGAAAAPFLVGGDSEGSALLFAYYGLLAAVGLGIDAVRRWGWVSALALTLSYAAAFAIQAALPAYEGFVALMLWLALAAVLLPRLELRPTHPGPTVLQGWLRPARREESPPRPVAPTWIAAAGVAAASALIWLASGPEAAGGPILAALALTLLALVLILWTDRAEGLADLPLVPAGLLVALVPWSASLRLPIFTEFRGEGALRAPGDLPPGTATLLLGCALALSFAAWLRSRQGSWPRLWAAAAAIAAPAMAVALELWWRPAEVLGAWTWALHAMGLAVLMVVLAGRYAATDGKDRSRAAYATLSALSLIALAVFVLLSAAALTVALAVLVAAAAWLDRRFRLPEMGWFVAAGVATLGWRLVVDPGLLSYLDRAPLPEVLLAFGAAVLGLGAARVLLPPARRAARAAAESGALAYAGVLLSVLVWRLSAGLDPMGDAITHWSASLWGLIWLVLALAQLRRATGGGILSRLRRILAAAEGALAGLALLSAAGPLNPALAWDEIVRGPQPFDTLLVAYLLPALAFAALAQRALPMRLRRGAIGLSVLFGALWVALAIRRFWQGDVLSVPGFSQPELYSYTVALLVAAGVLLYQALATGSVLLRRIAMGLIGVAVAKVFLVDVAGLTGLLRVLSFLVLGLMLALLAWFDRWAAARR